MIAKNNMSIGHRVGEDKAVEYRLNKMIESDLKEKQLSRALANAIDDMKDHTDLPEPVREAFQELYDFYQWQMENDLP